MSNTKYSENKNFDPHRFFKAPVYPFNQRVLVWFVILSFFCQPYDFSWFAFLFNSVRASLFHYVSLLFSFISFQFTMLVFQNVINLLYGKFYIDYSFFVTISAPLINIVSLLLLSANLTRQTRSSWRCVRGNFQKQMGGRNDRLCHCQIVFGCLQNFAE